MSQAVAGGFRAYFRARNNPRAAIRYRAASTTRSSTPHAAPRRAADVGDAYAHAPPQHRSSPRKAGASITMTLVSARSDGLPVHRSMPIGGVGVSASIPASNPDNLDPARRQRLTRRALILRRHGPICYRRSRPTHSNNTAATVSAGPRFGPSTPRGKAAERDTIISEALRLRRDVR